MTIFKLFYASKNIKTESDNDFLKNSGIMFCDAKIGLAVRRSLALTAKIDREEVLSSIHPNTFARKMRTWIDVWDPLCFACYLEKELAVKFISRDDIKPFPVFLSSRFFGHKGAESIGEWTFAMVYDWYPFAADSIITPGSCQETLSSDFNRSSKLLGKDTF